MWFFHKSTFFYLKAIINNDKIEYVRKGGESMDGKSKEIYSELYAFLDSIDEERKNKIPEDLRELIKSKKDENYLPKYPKGAPLEKLKMKKETKDMINLLNFNYWCENEKERKELMEQIANGKRNEKSKSTAFDKIKNIFKKKS